MRRVVWTCALTAFSFSTGLAGSAHADTISVTVSTLATGSFNGQLFQGAEVTFTGQTTSAEVAACAAGTAAGCTYFQNAYQREYLIPYTGGTVSVEGFGTFAVTGPEVMDYLASSIDMDQIRLGSTSGGLTFGLTMPGLPFSYNLDGPLAWSGGPQGSFLDGSCSDGTPSQCPYFAPTSGGELRLTQAYAGGSGQIALAGATALTPEPGTWVMVGTGLAGALRAGRRRIR